MKEFLTESTLFATIAMFAAESTTLLLVVEGDDDQLVLREHVSADVTLLAGVGGRSHVLRAATLATRNGFREVRFLVDRDYDAYTNSKATDLNNVVASTRHDIFMDILSSDNSLLRRIIDVHSASARRGSKRSRDLIPDSTVIAREALSLAACLSAVRIVNDRATHCLDFKSFSFHSLKPAELNVRDIAAVVCTRNKIPASKAGEIVQDSTLVYAELILNDDLPVGDHDLFSALSRILKKFGIGISSGVLQSSMIVGVSCSTLQRVDWFKKIESWCESRGRVGFTCGNRSSDVAA